MVLGHRVAEAVILALRLHFMEMAEEIIHREVHTPPEEPIHQEEVTHREVSPSEAPMEEGALRGCLRQAGVALKEEE